LFDVVVVHPWQGLKGEVVMLDLDSLDLSDLFKLADAIPDRRSEEEKAAIAKELSKAKAELTEVIERIED
jgi:hypothetical protein